MEITRFCELEHVTDSTMSSFMKQKRSRNREAVCEKVSRPHDSAAFTIGVSSSNFQEFWPSLLHIIASVHCGLQACVYALLRSRHGISIGSNSLLNKKHIISKSLGVFSVCFVYWRILTCSLSRM